jgi:hypothetical protein
LELSQRSYFAVVVHTRSVRCHARRVLQLAGARRLEELG